MDSSPNLPVSTSSFPAGDGALPLDAPSHEAAQNGHEAAHIDRELTRSEREAAQSAQLRRGAARAGLWLALSGAMLFSGKAIVVKLAYRYGIDARTLLAMRMLLSMPFFAIALVWWRPSPSPQKALSAADMGLITLAGVLGYYAASLLDFMGLQYISSGLERLILFTYPSIVLLITAVRRRQRPASSALMAMAISYLGLLVVYGHEARLEGTHAALGAALVLASSFCYAAYLLIGGSLLKRLGTIRVTSLATLAAGAAILLQVSLEQPWSIVWHQPLVVWELSAINALFCTVVPVFTVMLAIARIGANRVSQISMIGPISTIGLGTVILGEPFTWLHAVGTVLVLAGIALLSFGPSARQN